MVENGNAGAGPEICVIFSTVPASKSRDIARALLDRHLVACVNMTPVRSWYRWKGEFCDDEEHLLILKTRKEMAEAVIAGAEGLASRTKCRRLSCCRSPPGTCPTLRGCIGETQDMMPETAGGDVPRCARLFRGDG